MTKPDPNWTLVFAHRGQSASVPESTMISFKQAYDLGVDYLETDARLTRDHEVVLFHDSTLDRTTNGKGKLIKYSLAELKALDLGFRFQKTGLVDFPFRGHGLQILTLAELLGAFPRVHVNIDLKQKYPTLPARVAAILHQERAEDRVIVASFHQKQINRFRQIACSRVTTSAGPIEVLHFVLGSARGRPFKHPPPYAAFQVPVGLGPIKIVTPRKVAFAHEKGVAVQVWTINEPDKMLQLIEWGVDGIFTDKPELLLQIKKSCSSTSSWRANHTDRQ